MGKEKKGRGQSKCRCGQGGRREVENRREEEKLERKICNLETMRILFTTTWGVFCCMPCVPTLMHTYYVWWYILTTVCGRKYLNCN